MPLSGAALRPSVDDQPGITPQGLLYLSGYCFATKYSNSAAQMPFSGDTPT
jgi:hypothetical protein